MEPNKPFDLIQQRGVDLQPYYQADEISLIDLWNMLAARKLLVFGVLLACLIVGAVVIIFTSPLYESRTVINVGQITGVGKLEVPAVLVQRLSEEYRVNDSTEGKLSPPYLSEVSISKDGGGDIVVLKARGKTAKQASQFLDGVVAKILRQHQDVYEGIRQKLQKRLESLQNELTKINGQIGLIGDQIRSLGNSNTSLAGTLTLEKASLMAQLPDLEDQINKVRLNLSPVQSSPTTLIRQPTVPIKPVQPRPVLYIALSLVLGVVLGILSALFAEFLAKAKAHTSGPTGLKV